MRPILATPTALTCATSRMGNFGILLRKSHVFETLCKVNHLIVDKTGTLTHGDIVISDVSLHGDLGKQDVLKLAAALEAHANHPLARAFRPYHDTQVVVDEIENIIGSGIVGQYNGQPLKIGSAGFVLGNASAAQANAIYLSLADKHIATFIYQDPIRKEAQTFIKQFQQAGVKVTLLTGDSKTNAELVANAIGIDDVVAEAKPQDKLDYLQSGDKHDITMMIGDGINDAPTSRCSSVGCDGWWH